MSEHPHNTDLNAPAVAARLRAYTPARVGLGRTGVSQQARHVLAFQLPHAQARDAVHARMDAQALQTAIMSTAVQTSTGSVLRPHSAASDRATYPQRPGLGRRLDENSRQALACPGGSAFELAIIDSLGAYITWQPRSGRDDAERNCISNIRSERLNYREAATQLVHCCLTARQRRLSGTALGEPMASLPAPDMDGSQR